MLRIISVIKWWFLIQYFDRSFKCLKYAYTTLLTFPGKKVLVYIFIGRHKTNILLLVIHLKSCQWNLYTKISPCFSKAIIAPGFEETLHFKIIVYKKNYSYEPLAIRHFLLNNIRKWFIYENMVVSGNMLICKK